MDEQLGLRNDLALVGQGLKPNLVQGIGRVIYQLLQEKFIVAVESVEHQAQQLVDLRLVGVGLDLRIAIRHLTSNFCKNLTAPN